MSKRSYFSEYESPNIVIVPTVSFYNVSARKKMRLGIECSSDERKSKNTRQSETDDSFCSNLKNNCVLVKNIETHGSETTNLRYKHSSNISRNKLVNSEIKPSRFNIQSESSDKASKVKEFKVKPSTYKKVNVDQNSDISESSTSFKRDVSYKTAKSISKNKKHTLTENITKKLRDSVCNQKNNKIINTDTVPLKCANKQYIPSSSRKDKACSNRLLQACRDDIIKDKIPRNLVTNKSKHYDTYIDSKVSKNRQKSKEVIKQDKPHQNSNFKYIEQRNKKEKCKDKTPFDPEIENIYHNKKIQKYVTTQCCNSNDPIKDYKKNNTNNFKHEPHMHSKEKTIHTSTSKNKNLSKNKDTLSNQKKLKIQNESPTNNYNTKTIDIKKYQDKIGGKNKKVDPRNKSELNNNKSKLKLSKIDTKRKNPSQENKYCDNLIANCQESSNACKNLTVIHETSNKKHESLGLSNTNKLTKPLRKKEIKLIINLVVKNSKNKHMKTVTHDTNSTKTEDTKTLLLSNSELSFLDDINIDEIVDSLKQPKVETNSIQQELQNPNRSANGPIIRSDDESDTEETTIRNEIGGLNCSEEPVKIQKHNKPIDEFDSDKVVDLSHFTYNNTSSEQRAQIPVVINPTTLTVEEITNQEVIEEKNKFTSIDKTEVDNMVEALSDLKHPEFETNAIQQELQNPNRSANGLIIISDDESDTEEITVCNEIGGLNCIDEPVKIQKHNKPIDEFVSDKAVDLSHFTYNNTNSEQRAQIPVVINPTTLTVEEITKQEVIEEKDKFTSIDITEDDDMVEALSDCSTVILGGLDQPDIEICDDISDKKEDLIVLNVNETKTAENDLGVECSKNQTKEIVSPKRTQETITLKDPIEAQLNKMFEIDSSDTLDIDKNVSVNINSTMETVQTVNTSIEKPEVLGSANHTENLILGHNIQCNSKDNANKDGQCKILNKTNIINTSSHIKQNTTVIESRKLHLDTRVKMPLKTVKSEVRKITKKKSLPLTQDDKIFIDALEARFFLKSQYTVTSLIHKGKHSKIYQCKDFTGINYALKILNNTRDGYYSGIQKKNMIANIQKDIPKEKLYCVYLINSFSMYGYWCFLMEYYPKTLLEALQETNKTFHIDTVKILAKQLIVAVTVIRNNNIVHSDIKPAHILINSKNDRIKLCGFDTSYYMKEGTMAPNIGTVNYRAPEVILGYSSGFSVDVWSTGLVMYEMATKIILFPGLYNNDILYKQQCTLGGVPDDMLEKSVFKANHFYEKNFMRKIGFNREVIQFIYNFKKNKRIHRTLLDAYAQDWSQVRTKEEQTKDLAKLGDFQVLLEQMLVMHPKHRLSIEFVYANPFIYGS